MILEKNQKILNNYNGKAATALHNVKLSLSEATLAHNKTIAYEKRVKALLEKK